MAEWRQQMTRIAQLVEAWTPNDAAATVDAVRELSTLLGSTDCAVGFAAKEALHRVLCGSSPPNQVDAAQIVRWILGPPNCADPTGVRFALLRQMLKVESERQDAEEQEENDELETGDAVYSPVHWILDGVFANFTVVEARVRRPFDATKASETGEVLRYEALVFASGLLKCVRQQCVTAIELSTQRIVISQMLQLVERLMDAELISLDYREQPAYVCVAVLNLLDHWHELAAAIRDCSSEYKEVEPLCYSRWLSNSVRWLAESSCTTRALALIRAERRTSHAACQGSFIERDSDFPFLQKWILFVSRLVRAIVDDNAGQGLADDVQSLIEDSDEIAGLLPSRHRVLSILSEQDDVMVEVLNALLHITAKLETDSRSCNAGPTIFKHWARLADCFIAEYDPDLLFADLLDTFAFDHLVLLDFLTSSETVMLQYLMHYLRRLGDNWARCRRVLDRTGRMDKVLSTLIRLQLEITRLVAADIFPYHPTPLLRRLEAVERAYEDGSAE